ncbi:MAG: hypothetical protein LW714_05385 [Oxalobacteraceae bacterium]|nr:hypothetical protein [Oxalobacteraceae bacterium]
MAIFSPSLVIHQFCVSGFALLEAMISLVVVTASVVSAVLVTAHTQLAMRESANQHTAWRLSVELAAWLRAGGTQPFGNPPSHLLEQIQDVITPADCYAQACVSLDAARFYIWQWRRRLMRDLPGAKIVLCREGQTEQAQSYRWRWACPSDVDDSSYWLLKLGWPDHLGSTDFPPKVVFNVGQIR